MRTIPGMLARIELPNEIACGRFVNGISCLEGGSAGFHRDFFEQHLIPGRMLRAGIFVFQPLKQVPKSFGQGSRTPYGRDGPENNRLFSEDLRLESERFDPVELGSQPDQPIRWELHHLGDQKLLGLASLFSEYSLFDLLITDALVCRVLIDQGDSVVLFECEVSCKPDSTVFTDRSRIEKCGGGVRSDCSGLGRLQGQKRCRLPTQFGCQLGGEKRESGPGPESWKAGRPNKRSKAASQRA